MKISIITPVFNNLEYLKRNVMSIADQEGNFVLEHLIIDGGSNDGTTEFLDTLKNNPSVKWISEPDSGMYNGLNKGMNLATGDIIGHLNSDEQYLPGALERVAQFFNENPEIDIIYGHSIFIDPNGNPICFRKSYTPKWYLIKASYLYLLTCTIFFRRSILLKGYRYNESLKSIGDEDFFCRLFKDGFQGKILNHYTSAFTLSGQNLSLKPVSFSEIKQREIPLWIKIFKPLLTILRVFIKFFDGAYNEKIPLKYSIYLGNNSQRVELSLTTNRSTFK